MLSICFFCVRFYWSIANNPLLQYKWVKVIPHIIDTLLLSFGVYLLFTLQLWLNQQPWLVAKILALIIYICLGTFAIKRGRTQNVKLVTGFLAIIVYLYMINVAISHNPFVFF
jgi:uncharacterized membrane protein SirB2